MRFTSLRIGLLGLALASALSGCVVIDGLPHISLELSLPEDGTAEGTVAVNKEAPVVVAETDTEAESDIAELQPELAWLDDVSWTPSNSFDIASRVFPPGMRDSGSDYVWEFRPVDRPDDIDWERLAEFGRGDSLAETNAFLLATRREALRGVVRPDELARVKELAVHGFDLPEPPKEKETRRPTGLHKLRDRVMQTSTEKRVGEARLRAAAIEVWGLLLVANDAATEDWYELAGLFADAHSDHVREQIIRSLGTAVAPTRLRDVAELLETGGLERKPASFRRAVVDGCLRFAIDRPEEAATINFEKLVRLQSDRDPKVRRGIGRLAAIVRDPDSYSILKKQTADVSPAVREAAYESLGLLGTDDAIALLHESRDDPAARVRAAVVTAFALCRPSQPLGLDDESSVVRQAAARALTVRPTAASSEVAKKLVQDPDRQVQAAAVSAIAEWPDDLAIPVLAKALVKGSTVARRAALPALRLRTGIEDAFPIDGSPLERDERMRVWLADYHLPSRAMSKSQTTPVVSQANKREIERALSELTFDRYNAKAWEVLRGVESSDFVTLERLLHERRQKLEPLDWPELWNEILPRLREDFAALRRLSSRDANERVAGAIALAEFAESQSPSVLVIDELSRVLKDEQNAMVWRNVMAAISHDAISEADKLIPLALNSPWPDVRLLACEYIEREQRPEHGRWLAPLLDDEDLTVRMAAVRAAGACGHPALIDGTNGGLRAKLAEPSRDIRLEAATAMARLGDVSGLQELLHLAKSPDVGTRRKAASGLKLAGSRQSIDPVLSLAWTERDPKTRQAYFDLFDRLSPTDEPLPAGLSDEQKLELWTARLMQGNVSTSASSEVTAPKGRVGR